MSGWAVTLGWSLSTESGVWGGAKLGGLGAGAGAWSGWGFAARDRPSVGDESADGGAAGGGERAAAVSAVAAGSMLDPLVGVMEAVLGEWPQIKAPRMTEILREHGYCGSVDVVKRRLRELRPPVVHARFGGENRTPRQPVDGQNVGSQ